MGNFFNSSKTNEQVEDRENISSVSCSSSSSARKKSASSSLKKAKVKYYLFDFLYL